MNSNVRMRLSIMMFLQFFIWGAWYVTMATYVLQTLKFTEPQMGSAYSTTAWAAIISPFIVGLIADRFFPTQIVLGVMHILGGVAIYFASTVTDFGTFFWVLIVYSLCYMPTLALTNAIAFRQMDNPAAQFPLIRVLGTIGWIVAGLTIGFMKIEATSVPMKIAAGVSIVMGIFSFTLPHTPPQGAGKKVTVRDVLGLDALQLMKSPSFAIFVISSLLICIPLSFYYNLTNAFLNELGVEKAAAKMTMGQMSEIFFMVVMPLFFVRLGVKWMLVVGMLAWTIRYLLFAYGNPTNGIWMLYLGILLHGICYDFFFVTGQIYVDKKAPQHLRASAQGFITLITLGLGMLIGTFVMGQVSKQYAISPTEHVWKSIWLVPAAMSAVVMVLFALLFRDKVDTKEPVH